MYKLIILLIFITISIPTFSIESNYPVPPKEHPRVFIRATDIPNLKRKFNSTDVRLSNLRRNIIEQSNMSYGLEKLTEKSNLDHQFHRAIEANAFLYVVNNDKKAGLKAKEMTLTCMRKLYKQQCLDHKRLHLMSSRNVTNLTLAAGIVYDWCYDLFSLEEKKELINHVIRLAKISEFGWPIHVNKFPLFKFIAPHWAEEKHPCMLGFGIACYDEDPSIYNSMVKHLYDRFVPIRNLYYASHKHSQGSGYGPPRFSSEILGTNLMMSMGFPNPHIEDQGKMPHYFTYLRRPDNKLMTEGDDFSPAYYTQTSVDYVSYIGLIRTATLFQDPFLQSEVNRLGKNFDSLDRHNNAALVMLAYDDLLKAVSFDKMPLTKYFPSPYGTTIARTGWDLDKGVNSGAAIVKFDIQEYDLFGHTHADAGNFSIYYKGPLIIDAGAYAKSPEGKTFNGSHFKNYYKTTYAHNTLLIFDEDGSNGTQKFPYRYTTISELEKNHQAEIMAHEFGPDLKKPIYSYSKGDIANSYESAPDKAERSFLFLNFENEKYPGCFITLDHIITLHEGTKRWMIHSETEPQIQTNKSLIQNANGGQLINYTLHPIYEEVSIKKIGGKGKEFIGEKGKNWPLKYEKDIILHEAGSWTINIENKIKTGKQYFLNVMHIKDSSAVEFPTKKIENKYFIGAEVGNNLVFFGKKSSRKIKNAQFTIPNSNYKKYNVFIADLFPGNYNLLIDNKIKKQISVSSTGKCFYADELSCGEYSLERIK
ncbi:MAG: heparinase II/III family protein [Cyclobacteriaceae bacterium]